MSTTRFRQAEERLAARLSARHGPHSQHGADLSSTSTTPQRGAISLVGRTWTALQSRDGTKPAFRVGQVDAELLDEELLDLLKGQIGDVLKYFGAHVQEDWSAEILLALRAILFKITTWDYNASYGAALQNLKYTDARCYTSSITPPSSWQKTLQGLVTIGGRYALTKWEDWLVENEDGQARGNKYLRTVASWTDTVTTTHSIAALFSFLIFLVDGKYRTILDRILRMRLVAPTNQVSREVSFEYLNRQLVWHAFTEFLLFMLPLVGINRWKKWLARAWRRTKALTRNDLEEDHVKQGELAHLPEQTCAICHEEHTDVNERQTTLGATPGILGSEQTDITNPYETSTCGCVYCYVCLTRKIEAEGGDAWTCLRCGEPVRACRPWRGDVMEVLPAIEEVDAQDASSTGEDKVVSDADGSEQGHFEESQIKSGHD